MELNSWLRSLHERCPKHRIDSSRKFQDQLQTQGNNTNLNDNYNKNTFVIATTKIIINKNICMYTYSNTVPESPSPATSEVETTSTSSIISLFQSDSEPDQSTDSLPPFPKKPHIEQEPEVSVVNIDVAYLAKRKSSLTEHEKYNFYCFFFTPDIDYKFPHEGVCGFLHWYLRKHSWLTYSWQENGGDCLPCVLFARSIDVRKDKGVLVETAFTNFKKMYEVCDLHAARENVCDGFVDEW